MTTAPHLSGVRFRAPLTMALMATVMLVLSACTSAPQSESPPAVAPADAPEFSGPWGADFTLMYSRAGSDFERRILKDELIDDGELTEVRQHFADCLEAFGFTKIAFGVGDEFEFEAPEGNDPDAVNGQVGACAQESGNNTVGTLYSWIRRNPENLDEDTIMAACMVREGAVDPSYGADDFAADEPDQSFPYLRGFGDSVHQKCNADPLGLFE